MEIKSNFDLTAYTTFKLPVKCKYFAEYEDEEQLKEILKSDIYINNISFQIGGGSNLVFTKDFEGLILHSKIDYIHKIEETPAEVTLRVGAGTEWDKFVEYCIDNNLYGTENLSYIPGEVGASAVQNIGSYGAEVKDIISKVYCIAKDSGVERIFTNEECEYNYRDSIFKKELKNMYIVVAVEYKLSKIPHFTLTYGPLKVLDDAHKSLQNIREIICETRDSKLPNPKFLGSVGSFFMNPIVDIKFFNSFIKDYPNAPHYIISKDEVKIPAGWLIENSGLKGLQMGGAKVYEKQCLVLVNENHATAKDVTGLVAHIIDTVKTKYNIELHPEANII